KLTSKSVQQNRPPQNRVFQQNRPEAELQVPLMKCRYCYGFEGLLTKVNLSHLRWVNSVNDC
ncbi:MAG: hypothetical protein ACE1Y1_08575, partial [Nitrosomonadaceae bacterium]